MNVSKILNFKYFSSYMLERIDGLEPTSSAWKAVVLPVKLYPQFSVICRLIMQRISLTTEHNFCGQYDSEATYCTPL